MDCSPFPFEKLTPLDEILESSVMVGVSGLGVGWGVGAGSSSPPPLLHAANTKNISVVNKNKCFFISIDIIVLTSNVRRKAKEQAVF